MLAITISSLLYVFLWIVIGALIFWLLTWALAKIGLPEPWNKILNVLLTVMAVFILISLLLSLAGHPIIVWK